MSTEYLDYFGSVHFRKPVVLASDIPYDQLGYARRTINGEIVYVWYGWNRGWEEYQPFVGEWEFSRIPYSQYKQLRWMWARGGIQWFRLDGLLGYGAIHATDGLSGLTHFSGQKVSRNDVINTSNDQWNGKLKIYVMYAYPL